jgi:RHS repeat-associated protein
MKMRGYSAAVYRYGFNNQEKDAEMGEAYAFEYRIHDARLGRFLSVDPLANKFPFYSPYQFCSNSPIMAVELEGLESSGTGTNQSENSTTQAATNEPTDEEKFKKLIILPQEPLKPEKTFEDWKKENKKPEKSSFKDKTEYQSALGKYNENKQHIKAQWDKYNDNLYDWKYLRHCIDMIAKGGTENFKDIRNQVITGGVMITITMGAGSDPNELGFCKTFYEDCNENGFNCKKVTRSDVNIDIFKIYNDNFNYTEASRKFDALQPSGSTPKKASIMTVLMHELGHHCYNLSHLPYTESEERYLASEAYAQKIEGKTFLDGYGR